MNTDHPFTDPISGEECAIVVDPSKTWWEGGMGVRHPRCDQLADLAADLDAFWCDACQWNGRVAGAWAWDIWQQAAAKDGAV